MSVLIVIPARFASTRYPGKPLVELRGSTGVSKTLIRRSWDAANKVRNADKVVVATDDARIAKAAKGFGADVVMTSSNARNGTERCAEVVDQMPGYDLVVNLQGDAPLTPPWFVEALIDQMQNTPKAEAATPVLRCDGAALSGFRSDRAAGRVGGTTAVFSSDNSALYFSKEVIPYTGTDYPDDAETPVFHHVGVYAYRPDTLRDYKSWPVGPLETLEGLEQLRFLEQNRQMLCVEVEANGRQFWELNNPEDVPKIEAILAQQGDE